MCRDRKTHGMRVKSKTENLYDKQYALVQGPDTDPVPMRFSYSELSVPKLEYPNEYIMYDIRSLSINKSFWGV